MAERDTGFHPLDADYTRGRAVYIGCANGLARLQVALERRKVTLKSEDEG